MRASKVSRSAPRKVLAGPFSFAAALAGPRWAAPAFAPTHTHAKIFVHRRHRGAARARHRQRAARCAAPAPRTRFCRGQCGELSGGRRHHGQDRAVAARRGCRCDHARRPRLGSTRVGERDRAARSRVPPCESSCELPRLGSPRDRSARISARSVYCARAAFSRDEGRVPVSSKCTRKRLRRSRHSVGIWTGA